MWTSSAKKMGWDVLTFLSGYPSGEEKFAKNKQQGFPLKEMMMGKYSSQKNFEEAVEASRNESGIIEYDEL